jgi:phage FluMu protein Com
MIRSNFSVACPYCGHLNIFIDDDWHDELLDDACDHDIPCMKCGKVMVVTTHAVYTFSAMTEEEAKE